MCCMTPSSPMSTAAWRCGAFRRRWAPVRLGARREPDRLLRGQRSLAKLRSRRRRERLRDPRGNRIRPEFVLRRRAHRPRDGAQPRPLGASSQPVEPHVRDAFRRHGPDVEPGGHPAGLVLPPARRHRLHGRDHPGLDQLDSLRDRPHAPGRFRGARSRRRRPPPRRDPALRGALDRGPAARRRHNGVRDGDGREAAAPGHARDRTGAIRTVSRRAAGPRSCACSRTRLRRLRAPRSIRRRR